jgi:hypothetical protein
MTWSLSSLVNENLIGLLAPTSIRCLAALLERASNSAITNGNALAYEIKDNTFSIGQKIIGNDGTQSVHRTI